MLPKALATDTLLESKALYVDKYATISQIETPKAVSNSVEFIASLLPDTITSTTKQTIPDIVDIVNTRGIDVNINAFFIKASAVPNPNALIIPPISPFMKVFYVIENDLAIEVEVDSGYLAQFLVENSEILVKLVVFRWNYGFFVLGYKVFYTIMLYKHNIRNNE